MKNNFTFSVIAPGCNTKHAKQNRTPKTFATHTVPLSLYYWIERIRVFNFSLADKGHHFLGFFGTTCGFSGVRLTKTTAYHSQAKAQVEGWGVETFPRLRHYVVENQERSAVFNYWWQLHKALICIDSSMSSRLVSYQFNIHWGWLHLFFHQR